MFGARRMFSKRIFTGMCTRTYRRQFSSRTTPAQDEQNNQTGYYMAAITAVVFGLSYASVPLYKVFCQVTGFGGTSVQVADEKKAVTVKPVDGAKILSVDFQTMIPDTMPWTFTPTQKQVKVVPGETALAFYTAKNNSDKAIIGVATYNVIPNKAALYFNKIQCFCFEEQRLEPHEEVDMPVFFFIDPEILQDPAMENVNSITLSYTFFKTGEEEVTPAKASASPGTTAAVAPSPSTTSTN